MSSLGNHRIIEGSINSLVILLPHISKSLILGGLILKIVIDVTINIVLSSDLIGVLLILGLRTASHRLLLIGKDSECLHRLSLNVLDGSLFHLLLELLL